MAAGRSAAELGRFLAGRAGGLLAAAVLPAGGRDGGEDLVLAVAGPAKVAKWPVPERPIPPADEQRAGQRQARGEPRVRVSPAGLRALAVTKNSRTVLVVFSRPVPLHLPRILLAGAFVLALILPEPGGQLKETGCATASSQRG